MDRLFLPLDQDSIAWDWSSNTLVIAYSKPQSVLEWEQVQAKERVKLPTMISDNHGKSGGTQDPSPECKQQ